MGSVFYLLNLPDDVRKALAQLKDDKFKIEYLRRSTVLMELKRDNSLQEALGVDEDKIQHLLSVYDQILDIPKPIRYNDKNILKEKLQTIFVMFIESGLGQKEQINIIIDLFEQEKFEDYKNGWSENRFDRVRKSFYEPALILFNSVYGK